MPWKIHELWWLVTREIQKEDRRSRSSVGEICVSRSSRIYIFLYKLQGADFKSLQLIRSVDFSMYLEASLLYPREIWIASGPRWCCREELNLFYVFGTTWYRKNAKMKSYISTFYIRIAFSYFPLFESWVCSCALLAFSLGIRFWTVDGTVE